MIEVKNYISLFLLLLVMSLLLVVSCDNTASDQGACSMKRKSVVPVKLGGKTVAVSEKKPVAVSEKKPVAVSEKEPVAVSEKKPVAVSEKKPVVVSEKEPVAVSEKKPVVVSEKEPVAVSEKKQVVVSEKKPVAVSEKKPVAVSEKEPVVVSEKKPVAVSEKEPVAVSEKKPVAVSEKEPVAVSEKKQVELSSKVDEAKDIKNFDDIYDEMSRDEQAVIDYMRSVLTDPSIGSDGNYYHFDDDTLEDLLADFGIEKLQKICSVLKVIIEADRLIDQIKNKDLKEEAKIRFNVRKNDYSRHLKEKVFSMKDIKLIYSAFLYPSAEPSFSYPIVEVKREAACVLTAEKKYSALSSDDKAIIDYLAFSKACLYKDEPPRSLYTFYSFYVNLGKLDSAQFDNFMRDSRFKVLEGGTIDDVRNKTFKCSFNVQV